MPDEQRPSPPTHAWQAARRSPLNGRPAAHRSRTIFVLLAVMLALVGGLVAWLFLVQPFREPAFLTIPITEYRSLTFPTNNFAWQDGEGLRRHFAEGKTAFDSQDAPQLQEELNKLRQRDTGAVVLHLCGFVRTHKDRVYLLAGGATPVYGSGWLDLENLLDAFRHCPARHKLLILDLMRPCSDPVDGFLADDAAQQIHALLKQGKAGDFFVLCACLPGQVSLTSEEMERSVFGYYLDEGLRGAAACYPAEKKHPGQVTVKQLAAFVQARVDRWARANRGAAQTPVLVEIGEPEDFPLVVVPEEASKPAAEAARTDRYPPLLQKGWQWRDEWRNSGKLPLAPRLLHELETWLLRHEQYWRGRRPMKDFEGNLKAAISPLQERARILDTAWSQATSDRPAPLALAAAGETIDPKLSEALKAQLDRFKAKEPPALADAIKDIEEKFKDKVSPLGLARAVLELACAEEGPPPDRITVQFLDGLLRRLEGKYPETLFLKHLEKMTHSRSTKFRWEPQVIRQALQLVRLEGQILGVDPRIWPWIQEPLRRGIKSRQQVEAFLNPTQRTALDWEKLAQMLDDADKPFKEADGYAHKVEESYQKLGEALTLLPDLPPYLVRLPKRHALDQAWERACVLVDEVCTDLEAGTAAKPPAGIDWKTYLDEMLRKARELSDQVRQFRDHFRRLAEEPGSFKDAIGVLREIDALLETPVPSLNERLKLLDVRRQLALKLHQQTLTKDATENADQKVTPRPNPAEESAALLRQRELAHRRAKLSLDVLKLGGLPQSRWQPLDDALKQFDPQKPDPAAENRLAELLRKTWNEELPDQLREYFKDDPEARRDLTVLGRAIRLSYLVPPSLVDSADPESSPSILQRKEEVRRLRP
jgi:hypothetical protein